MQPIGCLHETGNEQCRMVGGVPGDVLRDPFNVFQ